MNTTPWLEFLAPPIMSRKCFHLPQNTLREYF
jgi:hypothetical protein